MLRTVVILSLFISLSARENPFFPSTGEADMIHTSNETSKIKQLNSVAIKLPSSSRVLEGVTLKYKNLDGSIVEKKVVLQNAIDWHKPIFVTQNLQAGKKVVPKSSKSKSTNYENIISLNYISLFAHKKSFKIVTNDTMIRNFLLTKPHRIVCDFKRDIHIRSLEKKLTNRSYFSKVRVGNHRGYYRVVIELDGYYRYKIENLQGEYILTLL